MMEMRDLNVDGLVFADGKIRSASLTVRVIEDDLDDRGVGISVSDDHRGILFFIPLEKVKDMIEVKPWENSD